MESAKELHIEALINEELDRIVEEHGYFNSDHEAYAVIKEEVEEVEEDLDNLRFGLEVFWEHVRNDDDNLENAEAIERNGIELIKEAVQVVACCRKYRWGHLKEWVEKQAKILGGEHDAD